MTYKDAGVNIDAGKEAIKRIKALAASTRSPEVLADVGPFSGLARLNPFIREYKDPVLVQSTDGVGTKIIIAKMMGKFDTIGIDLVNHCANDIVTVGAKPITLLDYIGTDKLSPDIIEQIIIGVVEACKNIGCSLIGGEMAEMPAIYRKESHDLVGCMTGVVEYSKIIDGTKIQSGDQLIGLASSGFHTNGFSLVRKIFMKGYCASFYELRNTHVEELGATLGEALLEPHRAYVNPILKLLNEGEVEIHGLAHITGGGIKDNLLRILPKGCQAIIHKNYWKVPPIFSFLQKKGNVSEAEMFRVFNMGIGMIVVVPGWQAGKATQRLGWFLDAQEKGAGLHQWGGDDLVFQIGDIKAGRRSVKIN